LNVSKGKKNQTKKIEKKLRKKIKNIGVVLTIVYSDYLEKVVKILKDAVEKAK